ncbi:MAG: TMEM165/GDT1 family protein, partial [Herbinix sp.]|nr:TMEM165/GDT1 family protein [Herbinix sp.]
MTEFIKAALLVVVAEMGDKTQLLAMAMASKYKVKQVMLGVLVATILNHALAVALGSYLSSVIPMDTIKIVAGVAFLVFGFWTLRGDKIDEDNKKKNRFGPVVTVAIAFFIAEMGDKTQLMTIAIAAKSSSSPLFILMGTTAGMLIADGIGIIGGAWMSKHVPDKYIKWVAGIIFIFFGTLTIYNSVPARLLTTANVIIYLIILTFLTYLVGVKLTYTGQACENKLT